MDAGFEPEAMIEHVADAGLTPEALILTHAHVDHIAGVRAVLDRFPGTPIWIHPAEEEWLTNPNLNLSAMMGSPVTAPGPDHLLAEGMELSLGPTRWGVLHTPGHSPGGIVLYNAADGVAFVGDTLFYDSIGRTDFPGSSFNDLADSIRTKLYALPDATRVLPGHGPETSIGREKRSNPFVPA